MTVEEYKALDFEHVTLESKPEPQCESCGTELGNMPAGIHSCPVCSSITFIELEV
jgi:predicted RNA-binding Zn-ribbon protein involved in translation (DUF1610 family)